jgi:hypothetical protein
MKVVYYVDVGLQSETKRKKILNAEEVRFRKAFPGVDVLVVPTDGLSRVEVLCLE